MSSQVDQMKLFRILMEKYLDASISEEDQEQLKKILSSDKAYRKEYVHILADEMRLQRVLDESIFPVNEPSDATISSSRVTPIFTKQKWFQTVAAMMIVCFGLYAAYEIYDFRKAADPTKVSPPKIAVTPALLPSSSVLGEVKNSLENSPSRPLPELLGVVEPDIKKVGHYNWASHYVVHSGLAMKRMNLRQVQKKSLEKVFVQNEKKVMSRYLSFIIKHPEECPISAYSAKVYPHNTPEEYCVRAEISLFMEKAVQKEVLSVLDERQKKLYLKSNGVLVKYSKKARALMREKSLGKKADLKKMYLDTQKQLGKIFKT